ncbi:hypothetical protein SUGI_0903470 [Cryptomeria japonica]|nr:hypothetical protein SUGI_0903410 [Cryptomeria japonica]GLJ43454.1 hypothetical protein SUGI_0903470 [Cryptomeria japonica]
MASSSSSSSNTSTIVFWSPKLNGTYYRASGNAPLAGLDKELENDCRAREALLCALFDQQIMGLTDKSTAKAIWDKFETLNEGEHTVKIDKLHGYRVRYENLKMEEDEKITAFI